MKQSPSPVFVGSIRAALAYWRAALARKTVAAIDRDRHNLYRAVEFGLTLPDSEATAAELATVAFPFVFARGYWREWLPLVERAAVANSRLPPEAGFRLLTRLGQLRRLNRKLEEALTVHQQALVLARTLNSPLLRAEAHYQLGRALRDARQLAGAEQQLQRARQLLASPTGKEAQRVAAAVYNALGRVAHDRGQLEEAGRYLEQAVTVQRQQGEFMNLADALHDLGNLYRARGTYEQALACYDEALDLLVGTAHRLNRIQIHFSIGVLYFTRQAYARAEAVFRSIDFPFLRETGHLHMQALILVSLGNALLYQARYEEAAALLQEAVDLWRDLADDLELANAVGSRGEALAALDRKREARGQFEEALALLEPYPENAKADYLRDLFTAELERLVGQTEQ